MACSNSSDLDFSKPWLFSDVVLSVEGVKFHVHKSTLSMWSPVFEKMFTSDFSERHAEEIDLTGKKAEEVEVLLNIIYMYCHGTTEDEEVSGDNYQFLLELAEEYQMTRVKELCIEYLSCNIGSENFAEFYMVADKFGLEGIMKESLEESIHVQLSSLESDDSFTELPDKTKVEFLKCRIKELEKTLEEYITTCSSLVTNVYRTVAATFDTVTTKCDDPYHRLFQVLGGRNSRNFNRQCTCCQRRFENANCELPYSLLKAELKKLSDLGNCNKTVRNLNWCEISSRKKETMYGLFGEGLEDE